MKRFILMFARHWAGSPGKIIISLFAIALGTAIVIISFSVSLLLRERINGELNSDGCIIYVANGTWNGDSIEENRPPDWGMEARELLLTESESIEQVILVSDPPFREFMLNSTAYQLRSTVGTIPGYLELFGLPIIAGENMTQGDIQMGGKKVWISEEMAVQLFGSANDALGENLQRQGRFGPGADRSSESPPMLMYRVSGVFETPSELARRSYGIGDMVLPFTSLIPPGMNAQMAMNFMSGMFVVRSSDPSIERVEGEIRDILSVAYGEDIDIAVWEGSPSGISSYNTELRKTVDTFTVSVNIFGIIILLISSLGIFGIMLVESLNRRKERALERAMGASVKSVITEFWSWSFMLSLIGAILGALCAVLFAKPVMITIDPLIGELSSSSFQSDGIIQPMALLGGILLAIVAGAVFGLLPALPTAKENISETLREI